MVAAIQITPARFKPASNLLGLIFQRASRVRVLVWTKIDRENADQKFEFWPFSDVSCWNPLPVCRKKNTAAPPRILFQTRIDRSSQSDVLYTVNQWRGVILKIRWQWVCDVFKMNILYRKQRRQRQHGVNFRQRQHNNMSKTATLCFTSNSGIALFSW